MAPSNRGKRSSKAASKAASNKKKTTGSNPSLELWLDVQESCHIKLSIVAHELHPLREINCPPPLVVFASSHMLSRIPYFAIVLSEPWQSDTPPNSQHGAAINMRILTLECAHSTSPSDYRPCMQFSVQNSVDFSSIDAVLNTLRCADHLLFDKCMEACMAYLVSVPWSVDDYYMVQQAMSSLAGVKPSLDLAEKLAPIQGTDVYRDVLESCIHAEDCRDFVMETFWDAQEETARLLATALVDTWVSMSKLEPLQVRTDAWLDLTNFLLRQEGWLAKDQLQQAFVSVSASVCKAFKYFDCSPAYAQVLTEFFSRFLTICEKEPLACISNAERAYVLLTWANVVEEADDPKLSHAFNGLVSTLPPHEPSLVELVKKCYAKPFFKPSFRWWHRSMIARMKLPLPLPPPPPPTTNKGGANADE